MFYKGRISLNLLDTLREGGGGGGIRTHGTLASTTVFETAPFDHSGTPPFIGINHLTRSVSEHNLKLVPDWYPRLPHRVKAASIAAAAAESFRLNRWV